MVKGVQRVCVSHSWMTHWNHPSTGIICKLVEKTIAGSVSDLGQNLQLTKTVGVGTLQIEELCFKKLSVYVCVSEGLQYHNQLNKHFYQKV